MADRRGRGRPETDSTLMWGLLPKSRDPSEISIQVLIQDSRKVRRTRLSCAQLEGGGEGVHSTARLLEPASAFLRAELPVSQHEMQSGLLPHFLQAFPVTWF